MTFTTPVSGRVILCGLLCLLSCTAGKSVPRPPPGEVSGWIQVFGVATGVVLMGPGGGYDADNGRSKQERITGCVREVGRDGQEPGEDEDNGDYVYFLLHGAPRGHYTLWIAATRSDTVTIAVEKFGRGAVVECGQLLKPHELFAGKRYRVDVDINNPAVVSKCGIRLGPLTEARWPRRFRSLLP
jgi:hypothetical protein